MITVGVIEDSLDGSVLVPPKPDVRIVAAKASDVFNRDLARAEVVFVWPGGGRLRDAKLATVHPC